MAVAHKGDPLAERLAAQLPHPALWLGIAWLILTVDGDIVLTVVYQTFWWPGHVGWWFDLATVLQEVIVFPLLAFFYLWAPRALLGAIASLRDAGIVSVLPEDNDWLNEASSGRQPRWIPRWLPSRWLLVYVLLTAALTALALFWTYTSSTLSQELWFAVPTVAAFKVWFWFLNSYMAVWLILRMTILVSLLGRLFGRDRTVNLEPLHPDGAGGLAPLAGFSLRLTAFIGFIGATFVLVERNYFFHFKLQFDPVALPVHVIAVFALAASALVFFAPLVAPHRIMADEKRKRLSALSRMSRDIDRTIDLERLDTLSAAAPKLDLIRSFYAQIERFPVWPFDTRILRFFFVAVVGQPALAVAIDIWKGDLEKLVRVILVG